ncbi:MAG: alpha/beta hydrolase [Oleiphilaceae bacterium]|nr:alpha/beta hydrolase [Oleiphilaceae bacterium]
MTEQQKASPRGPLSPDLVIVHGMWSTPDTLAELREQFEQQGYRVHTPALPFHRSRGDMDATAQEGLKKSGVAHYVAAVEELVNGLTQPPVLIGHSMGGLIAQLVAQKVAVERLVLLSSAAPAGINAWCWSAIRTLGHNLFKFPLWTSLTDLRPANIRYGIANTQTPELQDRIYQQSTYESGLASFQIAMWFLFSKPHTRLDPQAILCPVLLMGGVEDRITPIASQRKIARLYGDRATLVELPGVCHWTIGGHAVEKIASDIGQWLNRT